MSQFLGMDIGEVRTLSTQLRSSADEIQNIINKITHQLSSVQWVGPDASRFRDDWHGTHTQQLNTVKNALEQASQQARSNADQQEQASS
jgi:uncharacterized protein YukE